jgi:hypothetical protein
MEGIDNASLQNCGDATEPEHGKPQQFVQTAVGEFMKARNCHQAERRRPPPLHMHPNEQQFTLVLDGKLHFVLGRRRAHQDNPEKAKAALFSDLNGNWWEITSAQA